MPVLELLGLYTNLSNTPLSSLHCQFRMLVLGWILGHPGPSIGVLLPSDDALICDTVSKLKIVV